MTKVIEEKDLLLAKKELDDGNLVIFPTETVYGLGANALNSEAVDKIFAVKNRASNNPLIIHLKDKDEIFKYAVINNEIERQLIDTFMPGPFTIILQKKDVMPNNVTCNLDTVGIRVPDNAIAHHLLSLLNYPIAAPSANLSTRPSGTNIMDIFDEFDGKVKYLIDGGDSTIGLESTVCKVENGTPIILRPGFITKEDIESVVGNCNVSEFLMKKASGKVESPGMLYKHYAPKTKCILVASELMKEEAQKYQKPIILGSNKVSNICCYKYFPYGEDKVSIAHNLFSLLRKVDREQAEVILIEAVDETGLGLAIMNRLVRTCEFHYVKSRS